jgi:hypothetical protein
MHTTREWLRNEKRKTQRKQKEPDMAENKDKEKDMGELCHISICVAENGYKICCAYEDKPSLSQKAGWIPTSMCSKDYVEKSKKSVVARVEKILDGDCSA